uniref:Apoptosis-antagonizing transcription factor C-terminal domain-containing protein n=1 Tax=Acrobeloides nanus TaxID=290746 RepID=A0A914C252_9BILA
MDSDIDYSSDELEQESASSCIEEESPKSKPSALKINNKGNLRKRKHSSSDSANEFEDDDSGIIDEDIDIFDDKPSVKRAKESHPETFDPILSSRQWLEKRRKKIKKIVDTRASKGRKTRFITIPKLVNFHPAVPEAIKWTHERRNELFKSLFR